MDKYNVRLSDTAKKDINNAYEYIYYNLANPNAAIKIKNNLIAKMKSLSYMPYRNPIIERRKYNGKDIYKTISDNCLILYTVDEENKNVLIVRVAHSKRSLSQLLK